MSETVEETAAHAEGEKLEEEVTDKGKLLEMEEVQTTQPTTSQPQQPAPTQTQTQPETSEGESEACATCLQIFSILVIVLFFPFSLLCALKMVQEYERAVIFRLGRIIDGGAKGPGLFFVYPCMDTVTTVDMRTKAFDINPQEILTKDQLTVMVDAVIYLRIIDPVLSITRVENVNASSKMLGATTLRNTLGTYNMTDILSKRDEINSQMKVLLDEATDPWGVDVERVEITDVRLPEQMQRAMAAEAEATREARAKVIAAEGEQRASRALKEAADVMIESPAAMQLRYLQTLNTISAEKNSTIIFPLPLEFMQVFKGPQPSQSQ
ncbi:band 7 protein AGAP004871-like [Mercenaria mercenaria]|uniref:band 7 protein AGAP004871-like n=1 Tax=Mercenaria mercenaria TaxID=6596 RepID=UPI00234E4CFB|nr:band 7 protein AGAP004871-like [Mercenaria mercenaria]XP_053381098.1 band 7 protein AGAP004871-like [Mercenaria mercenaria]